MSVLDRVVCNLTARSVQVQQAADPAQATRYSGPGDVIKSLYREGGVRSIFRGSAATAARGEIFLFLALPPVMKVSLERFLRENDSYSWFLTTVDNKFN